VIAAAGQRVCQRCAHGGCVVDEKHGDWGIHQHTS
jgi:hypothetical protein